MASRRLREKARAAVATIQTKAAVISMAREFVLFSSAARRCKEEKSDGGAGGDDQVEAAGFCDGEELDNRNVGAQLDE